MVWTLALRIGVGDLNIVLTNWTIAWSICLMPWMENDVVQNVYYAPGMFTMLTICSFWHIVVGD